MIIIIVMYYLQIYISHDMSLHESRSLDILALYSTKYDIKTIEK